MERLGILPADGSAPASVVLVNAATNFRYSTTTDGFGRFAFELLPPGDYSARAESPGMSPQTTPGLHVDVGGTTELAFKLAVAGTKETVTVSGEPPLVESQPSGLSSLIDERAINELPLNGRRYHRPGPADSGRDPGPRGLTSGSNGDLAFGGIRGFQSSYLVDGGDNNNAFFGQARGRYRAPYQFSNEVVQEFRVSSNTYGADLGRAGGAVVNVVTKSGSNRLHGTDFYFLRDSALAATHPFMDFKPHDQQQQFGFTLGGPIRRNRAFFFAGFDQHIFHIPNVVRFINGSSVVVPQAGAGPATPGDYEASDQALVFATAATLEAGRHFPLVHDRQCRLLQAGLRAQPAQQPLPAAEHLALLRKQQRVPRSRQPGDCLRHQRQWRRGCVHRERSLSLTSNLSFKAVSRFRAQFSRDLQSSTANSTDPLTKIPGHHRGLRTRIHSSPPDPGAPPASGRNFERGRQKKFLEVRRRRAAHLDL